MPVNYSSLLNSPANWTFIASAAPSAVLTASFTSISGYKKLKIVGYIGSSSQSGNFYVQFNSDTGNNYYGGAWGVNQYMSATSTASRSISSILLTSGGATEGSFSFEIENANSTSVFKDINGASISQGTPNFGAQNFGVWRSTSAITSIQIGNSAPSNITGNIYLLGQN